MKYRFCLMGLGLAVSSAASAVDVVCSTWATESSDRLQIAISDAGHRDSTMTVLKETWAGRSFDAEQTRLVAVYRGGVDGVRARVRNGQFSILNARNEWLFSISMEYVEEAQEGEPFVTNGHLSRFLTRGLPEFNSNLTCTVHP